MEGSYLEWKTWKLEFEQIHRDDHGLAPNDFLLVGVSGHGHLHAIIFARHGGERIYEWF